MNISTDKGRMLAGITVYAFTDPGAYAGQSRKTDINGTALFETGVLATGTYKFRIDYLGQQIWSSSVSIPDTIQVDTEINEETTVVSVNSGGASLENIKVYLFTEAGSYLGINAITDTTGIVAFDLPVDKTFLFRADFLGNQYWSSPALIAGGGPNALAIDVGGGVFDLTVLKSATDPLAAVKCYVFNEAGTYLGQNQATDTNGQVSFDLSDGKYKFRIDHLGSQFWSELFEVPADLTGALTIPHLDNSIVVSGTYQGINTSLSSIKVYLFSATGTYLGQNLTTDDDGRVMFNLPAQDVKVRADYLDQQFWSPKFNFTDSKVDIPMSDAEVTVTGSGLALRGVKVYVFSPTGAYLGLNETTDADGKVLFRLPASEYKFRADYQGSQFWSDHSALTGDMINPVPISTGGGMFSFTVSKGVRNPLRGVNCYLFNGSGSYLGLSATTGSNGQVSFNLSDGDYKIRVDYQGNQFWSEIYVVPEMLTGALTIPHLDTTVAVSGTYQGFKTPLAEIKVYLFNAAGTYLGQNATTDADGRVMFNLPDVEYKVRADYQGQQFWSEVFISTDTDVNIPMADAEVTVTGSGLALEGIKVYAFSPTGTYLGLNQTTDADGKVLFRLPASDSYTFRADYQGSQYWSDLSALAGDTINRVPISTGGGVYSFTVNRGAGVPLVGVKTYVFNEGGNYLGLNATTDADGQVAFNLSDGSYKIRVAYLGYQHWSEVYTVPAELSGSLLLQHQDVAITVNGMYLGVPTPVEGIKTYLFTPAGTYLGQNSTTGADGRVMFNLPDLEYKVRADYQGQQFWSELFVATDTTISIAQGVGEIHLHEAQADISGARVYLFAESGVYLGRFETTDAAGSASFLVPAGGYKFRADVDGEQHWTSVASIVADITNTIDLDISPVSVGLSLDKSEIQVGESAILSWSSSGADSCTIEPGIGSVVVNGAVSVSPIETTTYTITATGSGGSAVSTASITVNSLVPTVEISAATNAVMLGDSVILTWFTAGAINVEIDQNIGPVDQAGSLSVSPTETTTYSITATGVDGISFASVTVAVVKPEFSSLKISKEEHPVGNWWDDLWFGASVDISDNYAVIGAPLADLYDNFLKEDIGAAYIYRREGKVWVDEVKLVASDGLEWDYFGSTVSISGDTVIVGASYAEVNGQYGAGAAYIFRKKDGSWVEEAKLTASNPQKVEYFGYAVSISGDHAIVGVDTNNNNLYTPKIYFFKYNGVTWDLEAEFSPSDAESYWHFGNSVSISGNYAVAGAPYNVFQGDMGTVYVYKYDGSTWAEETILASSDGEGHDFFGYSVSINGDYIIAGAIGNDEVSGGSQPPAAEMIPFGMESSSMEEVVTRDNAGAAYIFHRGLNGWQEQAKLIASDNIERLYFGLSVDITENYAVVGAGYNFNDFHPFNSNYVFKKFGTEWKEQNILYAGIVSEHDEFGPNVAISDNHIIIGDYEDDPSYINPGTYLYHPGAVYFYDMPQVFAHLSADPPFDPNGESVLSWSSGNAAKCLIEPEIGEVPCRGSMPVTVAETTVYTLTAQGPLGVATSGVTVTVGYPPPVLSAAITPESIQPGETAAINWETTLYTDSVTIDNGIGVMPVTGSVIVTPTATTTYTLIASGPGGSDTRTVRVVVLPPAVSIWVSPATIVQGSTAVLTWSSSWADSAEINNGIGLVATSGSTSVSPVTTTTYSITASGPSGTSTASATLIVKPPPPVATLTANPSAIFYGQSTMLSWSATKASAGEIGSGLTVLAPFVGPNGSGLFAPAESTSYWFRATGPGGTDTAAVTVQVLDSFEAGIAITFPTDGAMITEPYVLVQGIVGGTDSSEVGVTVNGIVAQVNGNQFFANNVPLQEGENTITATATMPDNTTVSHSIMVNVVTSNTMNWIELDVFPESGIAPLNSRLSVKPHLTFTPQTYEVTYTGNPGVSMITVSETEFNLTFSLPGLYTLYYTVTDPQDIEYSQKVMVNVMDKDGLDALLKAKWNGMKGALSAQDVEGGLDYFLESSKTNYRYALNVISPDLPQIVEDFQDIEMIYSKDNRTKFRMNRVHDIDGNPVTITYYIYFIKDKNGFWKIEQF
ncbi:MAG: hypothetical protein KKE17_10965 [Proteobacteria bacterium]|nr:hypothetical protein [Pseudomonadota bacterium]MBU1710513.1 hypothetical protein [Pseudomonadota bacterium]